MKAGEWMGETKDKQKLPGHKEVDPKAEKDEIEREDIIRSEEGELRITSVKNKFCENRNIPDHYIIHALPTARLMSGRNVKASLDSTTFANITFDILGQPPCKLFIFIFILYLFLKI